MRAQRAANANEQLVGIEGLYKVVLCPEHDAGDAVV
jgi:hypothetical protein